MDDTASSRSSIGDVDAVDANFSVQIRIRRLGIVVGGVLCVALVAVSMWFCVNDDGIVLETFNSPEKDESTRRTLLDTYNSYSGSITSVLIKPVELFLAMALGVGMLCFATELSVGDRHTARAYWLLLVVTTVTGYLLTNGFNAINVQLASRPVQPKITARDLSQRAVDDSFHATISTSNFSEMLHNTSLLEETARNPSSNTALRSAFLPIEPTPKNYCHKPRRFAEERSSMTSSFGFPQRAWQRQVLTEAVEPTKSLEFALDTNKTKETRVLSSHGVDAGAMELPMNASTAINLVLHSVELAEAKLKWWRAVGLTQSFLEGNAVGKLMATSGPTELGDALSMSLPDLFFNASSSPSDKDVLESVRTLLLDFFGKAAIVSSSEVRVEFSSRNLSDGLTFNALTIDIPLVPSHLNHPYEFDDNGFIIEKARNASSNSSASGGGDWFYDIQLDKNCSDSACVLSEPEFDADGNLVTIEPQVLAQSMCWNYTTQEEPPYNAGGTIGSAFSFGIGTTCDNISDTSVRVVSVGKRIQGDAITIGDVVQSDKVVRLKNARKVYSFTVGELSWKVQDLAKVYGAECVDEDATMCHGLRYNLSRSGSGPSQHLVVGKRSLPKEVQANSTWEETLLPLVSFAYKQPCDDCTPIPSTADLVLPRRFADAAVLVSKSADLADPSCGWKAEDYINSKELNHLYIEKSLQPAYTAAVFYLFQDGVVRDVLNISTSSSSGKAAQGTSGSLTESLAFLHNTQLVDVKLSSPLLNVVLSLVGCAILLAVCVGVGLLGKRLEEKLQQMATAHTIAEVLIDDKKFPSLFVKRVLAPGDDDVIMMQQGSGNSGREVEAISTPTLDGFRVHHVTLVHPDGRVVKVGSKKSREMQGLAVV